MGDEFEQNILVHIYYDGIVLLDEEEKYFPYRLNLSEFRNYANEKCEIFRYKIERAMQEDLVRKLRNKIRNVVVVSRRYGIPVKRILQTLFLGPRSQEIEFQWTAAAMKEFLYVPTKHYLENSSDSLVLKVKDIKFR